MDKAMKDIYIRILKDGWEIGDYEVMDNGCLSIYIFDPHSNQEDREYWVKFENYDGGMLRPSSSDKAQSFLITAGRQ